MRLHYISHIPQSRQASLGPAPRRGKFTHAPAHASPSRTVEKPPPPLQGVGKYVVYGNLGDMLLVYSTASPLPLDDRLPSCSGFR